jgi:hypothetical protein
MDERKGIQYVEWKNNRNDIVDGRKSIKIGKRMSYKGGKCI